MKPSTIIDYCEEQRIATPNGVNSRLTDEEIRMIVTELAPEQLPTFFPAAKTPAQIEEEDRLEREFLMNMVQDEDTEMFEEVPKVKQPIEVAVESPEEKSPEEEEEEKKEEDGIEVIRAPKIKLEGLKVKGKIELPEPKAKPKKEEKIPEEDTQQKHRGKNKQRNRKNTHDDFNPLAEERKRKALEEEKRRQALLNEKKQARAKHYQKIQQEVAKVKKEKPIEEGPLPPQEEPVQPKGGLFSKLRRLFN